MYNQSTITGNIVLLKEQYKFNQQIKIIMNSDKNSVSSGISKIISENQFIQLYQEADKVQELQINSMRDMSKQQTKQKMAVNNFQRSQLLFNKFRKSNKFHEMNNQSSHLSHPPEQHQEISTIKSNKNSTHSKKDYYDEFLRWKEDTSTREKNQMQIYENVTLHNKKNFNNGKNQSSSNLEMTIENQIKNNSNKIYGQFQLQNKSNYHQQNIQKSNNKKSQSYEEQEIEVEPLEKYKSTLKQKISLIESINNEMLQLEKTLIKLNKDRENAAESQQVLNINSVVTEKKNNFETFNKTETAQKKSRLENFDSKNFQSIIKHPPLQKKQINTYINSRIINSSNPLNNHPSSPIQILEQNIKKVMKEIEVQTQFKIDSYVQTQKPKIILKKLDLEKILDLNDYHFLQFIQSNKQDIEKFGTKAQRNLLNHRIKKIREKTNIKQLLQKVFQNTDQQTLKQLSDKHKERAYDFLFK